MHLEVVRITLNKVGSCGGPITTTQMTKRLAFAEAVPYG